VLLAGGQSRRMGTHKALLRVKGRSLLDNLVESLNSMGCTDVVIAGEPEPSLYRDELTIAHDYFESQGPVAGIHAGLQAATNDAVIVLPCDILSVPVEVIARLKQQFDELGQSVCAEDSMRVQPLFAIYKRSDFQVAAEVLQQQKRRMTALIEAAKVIKVDCSDLSDAFENINTPAEYKAAIAKEQESE